MKLRMPRGVRTERTKLLYLLMIDAGVSAEMQPGVKKHRAMSRAQDETITIQPFRIGGIVTQRVAVKSSTDFRTTEREAEVTGITDVNGVHGEAPGLVGRLREGSEIECHRFLRAGESRGFGCKVKNRTRK